MKKLCIISMLLATMALPMVGCVTFGGSQDWRDNVSQLKSNIFILSKLATRIALVEAKMPAEDVKLVKGYLVALRDLLIVPGYPNFTGARTLVNIKLPYKYQVYGLTIIDLLERYLQTTNLHVPDDQKLIIAIISSGIDGAITAVSEFAK